MKKLHLRSYGLGVLSGTLLLAVFFAGKALLSPFLPTSTPFDGTIADQQRNPLPAGGGKTDETRLPFMAERFGMTVAELQAELDAGKTLPEIAQERGMELGGSMRVGRSGMVNQGSGPLRAPAASGATLRKENLGSGDTL